MGLGLGLGLGLDLGLGLGSGSARTSFHLPRRMPADEAATCSTSCRLGPSGDAAGSGRPSSAEMPISGEGAASGMAACLRRLAMQPEEQVGLVDLGLGLGLGLGFGEGVKVG